jgi:AraC family transcriptional regulator of adaptative response / DNA-3-methyladenine glycosylase II
MPGMDLDPGRCYDALLSRDRRFDGRFFVGVLTTGVYCRPVCPAPSPKQKNIRFFACAAAAESAGFRPCLRCRPETSPGTPAWLGTSAVVSRALRLISEGVLDDAGVDHLAGKLGIGSRQLRRLFQSHLGASPIAIARARRLHLARRLIDETGMPIAAVAFSSGFSSVRQFNQAIRETFGRSPSQLRRKRPNETRQDKESGLAVRLPYRPPLDWNAVVRFLAPRAIPGVELVQPDCYSRTIATANGIAGSIELRPSKDQPFLLMTVKLPSYQGLSLVVERARRIFDLGADPLLISQHLSRNEVLAPFISKRPGLRLPGGWDKFELAIRAILGQQISVSAATTLAGRLVERFGTPVEEHGRGLSHLFPGPERLAEADLSEIGLPRARAETIRSLASAVSTGELLLDSSSGLEDWISRATAVSGIGDWTAHYIAMRAFNEPDAFPASDLGLRRALSNGATLSAASMTSIAEEWRPWRAYAAMHLWAALSEE